MILTKAKRYRTLPGIPELSLDTYDEEKSFSTRYRLLKLIGKGSFGSVFLAQTDNIATKRTAAIKVMSKLDMLKRKQQGRLQTELECLSICSSNSDSSSSFFPKIFGFYQSKLHLFIVQEYISGGELYFHLGKYLKLSEDKAKQIIVQCIKAIEFLHSHYIIYRDFKPENIMFTRNSHNDNRVQVKLVDFGLSKRLTKNSFFAHKGCLSFVGTKEYLAVEMITKVGHGYGVDFWSIGMVLYEMLCGLPPWYSDNEDQIVEDIVNEELTFIREFKPTTEQLIKELLDKNPVTRLGCGSTGFQEIKTHAYFENDSFDEECLSSSIDLDIKLCSTQDTSYFDISFTNELFDVDMYSISNESKQYSELSKTDKNLLDKADKLESFKNFEKDFIF